MAVILRLFSHSGMPVVVTPPNSHPAQGREAPMQLEEEKGVCLSTGFPCSAESQPVLLECS